MGSRLRVFGVIVIAVLLIGALVGTQMVDRPRIESIDNDWGTVTDEQTEVETHIVVNDPTLLRLGDAYADVEHTVALNDITVASGEKNEVELSGKSNTVNVSTWIDNDDIPKWWVSHIRNDETTEVRVDPEVEIDSVGRQVSAEPWTQTWTMETDILDSLETNESRTFSARGQRVFVLEETSAEWGNVSRAQTPINVSLTLRNALPVPIPVPISEASYTIRMNGVAVGNGTAFEESRLPPQSTQQLHSQAVIDNSKLDDWWVTHIQNDETTRLTIHLQASIAYGGSEVQLPVKMVANETFETDIFAKEAEVR